MSKYDLVIIGSGASGLSAGVAALKSGIKNVLILEKEDVLHFVPAVGWKGKIEL